MDSFSIKELECIFKKILQKLHDENISNVKLDTDYYWVITADEWADFNNKVDPVVGSLYDDLECLKKVCNDEQIMTYVDFGRTAALLRFISEKLNPVSE